MTYLVAICADSKHAPAKRPALLPEHGKFLMSLTQLRFSAPLANRDDAGVAGDGIESSVIILEGESRGELTKLLLEDPYASGGVWASIDIYEISSGVPPASHGVQVDFTRAPRWYLALNRSGEAPDGALTLSLKDRWTGEAGAAAFPTILAAPAETGWTSMKLFAAASFDRAASQAAPDGLTLAVPISAGSWTKRP